MNKNAGSRSFKNILYYYKTKEIKSKFLLTRDKFMPEKHLRQPGFT